jgi:hypothetical protein
MKCCYGKSYKVGILSVYSSDITIKAQIKMDTLKVQEEKEEEED